MEIAIPEALDMALTLLNGAIAAEPGIAADISKLFAGGAPSPADLAAFRASVAAETYGQFVPRSALPPSETGS